jgi:hypothetical protein
MFSGFTQRLEAEVGQIVSKSENPSLQFQYREKPYRRYMSWMGAAILASLSSFESKWITKAEYLEHGPQIMHKKSMI